MSKMFLFFLLNICIYYAYPTENYQNNKKIIFAGSIDNNGYKIPFYWMNNKLTFLDTPKDYNGGIVNHVLVMNSDKYFSGSVISKKTGTNKPTFLKESQKPCYWKNNSLEILNTPNDTDFGIAIDIKSIDNSVYIVGFYSDKDGSKPCYWKNGIFSDLQLPERAIHGSCSGIIKYRNKIIISGGIIDSETYKHIPCYWENNKINILDMPNGSRFCETTSIIEIDNNLYISGFYFEEESNILKPIFWKNGEIEYFDSNIYGNLISINEYNSKTYFAINYQDSDRNHFAFILENNLKTKLSLKNYSGNDLSAFIVTKDTIISVGCIFIDTTPYPCYWINRDLFLIPELNFPGKIQYLYLSD